MTIDELINKLPSDTSTLVKSAKERYNVQLRRAMREEGGLTLSDHAGDDVSIPIRLDVAFPKSIENQKLPNDQWLAVLVAPYRPVLEQLRNASAIVIEDLIPALKEDHRAATLVAEADQPIKQSHEFAEHLLKALDRFDLVKWLYHIDEHILGCYDPRAGETFLYWGVIGLVARQIGVTTEDLAAVVLGHELAHAYTHLGAAWVGNRFSCRPVP